MYFKKQTTVNPSKEQSLQSFYSLGGCCVLHMLTLCFMRQAREGRAVEKQLQKCSPFPSPPPALRPSGVVASTSVALTLTLLVVIT